MVVIFEGNECTYKSTLAEMTAKHYGIHLVKGSTFQSAKCSYTELNDWYNQLFSCDDVVFDRSFYSNRVYAQVYSGYSLLTPGDVDRLQRTVHRTSGGEALVVWCKGSNEILTSRLLSRGDDMVVPDKISRINEMYGQIMNSDVMLPMLVYNTEFMESEEFFEAYIKTFLKTWSNRKMETADGHREDRQVS